MFFLKYVIVSFYLLGRTFFMSGSFCHWTNSLFFFCRKNITVFYVLCTIYFISCQFNFLRTVRWKFYFLPKSFIMLTVRLLASLSLFFFIFIKKKKKVKCYVYEQKPIVEILRNYQCGFFLHICNTFGMNLLYSFWLLIMLQGCYYRVESRQRLLCYSCCATWWTIRTKILQTLQSGWCSNSEVSWERTWACHLRFYRRNPSRWLHGVCCDRQYIWIHLVFFFFQTKMKWVSTEGFGFILLLFYILCTMLFIAADGFMKIWSL